MRAGRAWISNDEANHRIALLAFPGFADDPEKETRTGLHHTAFEYASFEELNASYLRLKAEGIVPDFCLDHGMTFSYYYRDPDGNHVELQVDNFGDWSKSDPRSPRTTIPTTSSPSSSRARSRWSSTARPTA